VKLGRVVGTVVSTINAPVFDGRRLLVCDLVDPAGAPAGGYVIAIDTVGAGAGETVLLLDEGNSARQILGLATAPVRTVVVGIVDAVESADAERAVVAAPPAHSRAPRRRGTRTAKG
jgi:microcompartment protein CcmK/EutM